MAEAQTRPVSIFYSYAQKDDKLRKQLEAHLSVLKREGIISEWYGCDIDAGFEWASQIDTHLNTANIILLLVSPDFLASDYCYSIEMKRALERHEAGEARVIPIILRPVDWLDAPFAQLQALPANAKPISTWRDRDEAFSNVAEGILRAVKDLYTSPSVTPASRGTIGRSTKYETSLVQVWNIPYRRNPFFTGRETLLTGLHTQLNKNRALALTQAQVISGLGGIGKTQTAVEYAYRYREEYSFVLWINATTAEYFLTDVVQLATLLHLPEQDVQDTNIIFGSFKRWLETHTDWLLILDNVNDIAIVHDLLPAESGSKGQILLTTRIQAVGNAFNTIEIEKMKRVEGILLLLRRARVLPLDSSLDQAGKLDRDIAEAIVEEMDGMPLALDQAGAYIEETNCSLAVYLELYRTRRSKDLLQRRGNLPSDHPASVATTWSLSFKKVEQNSPVAAAFLRVCAFLAPDAIPEEIITEGAPDLGTVLRSIATDPFKLNEAIEVLRHYSLIQRDAATNTLSIHPLIQAVLKDGMNTKTQRVLAEQAVRAVNRVFPEINTITWSRCQRYLPQAEACKELIDQYKLTFLEAAQLLNRSGTFLQDQGKYEQAEPLYQRALTIYEQVLDPQHPDTATILNTLADLYRIQGKYEQAEPLYQRVLAIYEQALGPQHPSTATSLNNLALLYDSQGKYEQAEPLYQRALAIYEQALGPQHPSTATSLNNLALLYDSQGKYEQAEPLYQRALTIYEQVLGLRHPDTAQTLNNLASLYVAQGKNEQAEPLYQRALAIYEQALGPQHPSTAQTFNNLASLYVAQGKNEQAEPLYQRALAIYEQALGPQHPDTAQTLNNLASLYVAQGKYEQAEPLYQRALTIYEQVLDPQHPDTATILNTLADLYRIQGKYEQAEPLYQRALTIYEQVLGPQHPDTAQTLNNLASLYVAQGKYEQAEPFYQRALLIRKRTLGQEHSDTAQTLNSLALLYYVQGRYQQAAPLYQHGLEIYEKVLVSELNGRATNLNSPNKERLALEQGFLDKVIGLNDMGLLLQEMGDLTAARPFFELILKILQSSSLANHPHPAEQQFAMQEVLDWLQTIIQEMDTAQTSPSRLARTDALNHAISMLSDTPQQLGYFSQIGRLLIKRITDRWREVVTSEARRKLVILEPVHSPYIFTPPVKGKALVGRDDIFERITSLWARKGQRNSLLIHGHRRMGKTSIAQALVSRSNLGDDTYLVYLSLEGQALQHEGNLYQILASRFWLRFKNELDKPDTEDFTGENARTNFDFFLALLNEIVSSTRLVLVLDEFEMLYNRLGPLKANEVIAYLRAQTVTYTWMALALVGLSDLDDLRLSYSSSLLGWESIRISFLDAGQVKNVLANPSQDPDFPLDYTLEALHSIATLTNGQPYLVQVIGDRLVQRYNRIVFTEHSEHNGVFDINDIQAVLDDPSFYSTAAAYFEGVWGQAARGQPGEVVLLKALAGYQDGLDKTALRVAVNLDETIFTQALEALERHDVLCYKNNRISYTVPLMCHWVHKTCLDDTSKS